MNIEKDMEESLFQGLSIRDSSQQGALAGASLALSGIKKSVIIIHASSGCAWVARWMRSDHAIIQYTPVIATSLLEHEVIFGGKEKLKKTIDWVMGKWKPKQLMKSNIEFAIGQTQEKSLLEGHGIPLLPLAGLYSIFGSFNFIPYPFMGYRGMLYLLTMLGRLLEDTFHEKLRWEDFQ